MSRYQTAKIIALLGTAFVLSGCMFMSEPYRDVIYYDLSVPAPAPAESVRVSVLPIRDESSTKYKMVFRKNSNALIVDDYAKWTQPPGMMLTRYLENYFSKSDTNKEPESENTVSLSLAGSIFAFEADLESKEVVLGVKYEVRRSENNKLLESGAMSFREKVDEFSGQKLAAAMSLCAFRYAAFIKKKIEEVYPSEAEEVKKLNSEKLVEEEKEREALKKKEKDFAEQRKNLQARDDARTKAIIERAAAEKASSELEKEKAEIELKKLKVESSTQQDADNKK